MEHSSDAALAHVLQQLTEWQDAAPHMVGNIDAMRAAALFAHAHVTHAAYIVLGAIALYAAAWCDPVTGADMQSTYDELCRNLDRACAFAALDMRHAPSACIARRANGGGGGGGDELDELCVGLARFACAITAHDVYGADEREREHAHAALDVRLALRGLERARAEAHAVHARMASCARAAARDVTVPRVARTGTGKRVRADPDVDTEASRVKRART